MLHHQLSAALMMKMLKKKKELLRIRSSSVMLFARGVHSSVVSNFRL